MRRPTKNITGPCPFNREMKLLADRRALRFRSPHIRSVIVRLVLGRNKDVSIEGHHLGCLGHGVKHRSV